jgi:YfiH family protein
VRERSHRVGDGIDVPLLVSAVIDEPFRHGFTTRAGGVSSGGFASLNLGMKWGDARENVLENRRRLLVASGAASLHFASQVHGARVVRVGAGQEPRATAAEQADAVCTGEASVAVGVFVADCVPLLIADPRSGACAAVHAGWRGTVADVAGATVAALAGWFGARPADLRVAMGPSIGPCCFEVGPEVAEAFVRVLPDAAGVVVPRPLAKPHVDLRLANRRLLERAGVPSAQIDADAPCTRCDPADRFYSFRRDGASTGQLAAVIARLG